MITPKLILASGSPRRKAILENLGFDFGVIIPDTDEKLSDNISPGKQAALLAKEKAEAVKKILGQDGDKNWIAAFDTIVFCRGRILGKPENLGEAELMLKMLSGRTHSVISGIALSCPGNSDIQTKWVKTRVNFKKMSDAEIAYYLNTNEWQGVAGAYRIQEKAGFFVKSIFGCYFNVVGLPISSFYEMLRKNNYSFADKG